MVLENISPDLLTILLPVVIGVGMVLTTVIIIFWLGSGKKRTYEEAKALVSKKAEEKLKEREKEHTSPKPKKPWKVFRKKKTDEPVEEPLQSLPPRKVDFKLDTTPQKNKEDEAKKSVRNSPPTPYPKELMNKASLGPQIPLVLDHDEEEEAEGIPARPLPSAPKEEPKKKVPVAMAEPIMVTPALPPALNPSSTNTAPSNKSEKSGGLQKKSKAKSKPQAVTGE